MGGLPVQSKKYLKIYLPIAHRSEGPWPLNPPQTSVQPGNKNGEPETKGTRKEDAAPGGAQQSDACLGSRDTDEGQSPSAQPAARPMVSEAVPHPCSQGPKHPRHCQTPDKPPPCHSGWFQPPERFIFWSSQEPDTWESSMPRTRSLSFTPGLIALPPTLPSAPRQHR